jgi:hypothetical protein
LLLFRTLIIFMDIYINIYIYIYICKYSYPCIFSKYMNMSIPTDSKIVLPSFCALIISRMIY